MSLQKGSSILWYAVHFATPGGEKWGYGASIPVNRRNTLNLCFSACPKFGLAAKKSWSPFFLQLFSYSSFEKLWKLKQYILFTILILIYPQFTLITHSDIPQVIQFGRLPPPPHFNHNCFGPAVHSLARLCHIGEFTFNGRDQHGVYRMCCYCRK